MTALIEIETKCEGCKKMIKRVSGMEEVSIMDKSMILSLCKECSNKVRRFIKDLST